jgi:hypothetical protein
MLLFDSFEPDLSHHYNFHYAYCNAIIGMGIVMVPPMILEALYSYSPDNETVIEEATNSPLMMSTLPTLATALLILGLIGLGVHGLLKK